MTGILSAPKNTATSCPIRCIPVVFYGGKVEKYDDRTTQAQEVSPHPVRP